VDKSHGLLTIGSESEREKTAYFFLNNYVKKGNSKSKNRIFIVHRLDRDTSGVLVFAKSEISKIYLQEEWKNFSKIYYAIVSGKLKEKNGVLTSYLLENKAHIMYSTNNFTEGKLAQTAYKVIKESSNCSLLEINLLTGRKNQIRVHFSELGNPVLGDKIYGKLNNGIKRLALHAASLTIVHPFTKKKMTFNTELPLYFQTLIKFKID